MTYIKWASLLLSGIFIGVLLTIFIGGDDIDILSKKKNYGVSLKDVLIVDNGMGGKINLPKGTQLKFVSQYNEVGQFTLNIVITDLSIIKKSSGDILYFAKE